MIGDKILDVFKDYMDWIRFLFELYGFIYKIEMEFVCNLFLIGWIGQESNRFVRSNGEDRVSGIEVSTLYYSLYLFTQTKPGITISSGGL